MTERARTEPGYPFEFQCQRSGNCCSRPGGVVRVSEEEQRAIASYLKISPESLRTRYMRPRTPWLKDQLDGSCIFLEDGRHTSCGIYPVRPERCRTWPFWPELRDSPDDLAAAQRVCPGIQALPDAPSKPDPRPPSSP